MIGKNICYVKLRRVYLNVTNRYRVGGGSKKAIFSVT